ncbi:hypothetical protein NC652_038476 [Populus alba x Populus x berolinensis]|nr:hypothetical protein NC652_038476 [Populus alba x Populus x berolinensis]
MLLSASVTFSSPVFMFSLLSLFSVASSVSLRRNRGTKVCSLFLFLCPSVSFFILSLAPRDEEQRSQFSPSLFFVPYSFPYFLVFSMCFACVPLVHFPPSSLLLFFLGFYKARDHDNLSATFPRFAVADLPPAETVLSDEEGGAFELEMTTFVLNLELWKVL